MSTRPLDFFPRKKGVLTASGVSLMDIADATGTPVYVYSAEAFLAPLRELQKGLSGIDSLICFAVKSNSNIAILKMMAEAGAGADLVSGGELFRASVAGVPGNRIVFSGVGKTAGEIAQALEYEGGGIFSFNVESVDELALINDIALGLGKKASVALRFNPDVNAKTHPYISTGLKRDKFGLNRSEVLEIAHLIAEENSPLQGIRLAGLSIHIGSQILTLSPLNDAYTRAAKMVAEIETVLQAPLEFIDLGGGVGISYGGKEKPIAIQKYCALIRKHFGKRKNLKILLEPGRLISGNSGVLLTEVIRRKSRKEKEILILDAAMNDLIRPSLYGSHHEIVSVEATKGGQMRKTDFVGPVCESSDCFASDQKASTALGQGDLLAILSAGAYGFSMSGNYNSRPRPPEVLAQNGKFKIIRERESYEDLIRGESF